MSTKPSNKEGKAGPPAQVEFPDVEVLKIPTAEQHPHFNYNGFQPSINLLEKGHVKSPGLRPFGVPTYYERDQAITVRDGVRLYADVFRPVTSDEPSGRVPGILPWSPYGKTGTGPQTYDLLAPFYAGLASDRLSGYQKFEAPDPAEWSERGYAIVNIDARGVGHSEGVTAYWGNQEAEDVHDTIDWISKQPWCNGSVVMAGNSWLSIAQINYAARVRPNHPALKALAPWECCTDVYRHLVARGGRPHIPKFNKFMELGFAGPEGVEDVNGMLPKRPLFDDYWESKRIPVENIGDDVPVYLLASYSSQLHTYGSFDAFRKAKASRKWLRVHPYQEWYDQYRPEIADELQRYFDHYAKGVDNGWETTPRIRLSLLSFGGSPAQPVIERPETTYPPEKNKLCTYYLDAATRTMSTSEFKSQADCSYDAHHLTASADFTIYFDRPVELAGYSKATLWMSCSDHDDMDVAVQIRKISSTGEPLVHLNYPCPVPEHDAPNVNVVKALGPEGFLRASHRVSLEPGDSEVDLFYTHRKREPVPKGTVVKLEIPLWPIGMVFAAGEGIMLRVAGHDMCLPEAEPFHLTEPEDVNIGTHVIHTGGEYASSLTLPVAFV